jgi:hypothetical protein
MVKYVSWQSVVVDSRCQPGSKIWIRKIFHSGFIPEPDMAIKTCEKKTFKTRNSTDETKYGIINLRKNVGLLADRLLRVAVRICDKKITFKGTVQRKLTGVLNGINRKHMICHCSDGHSFFNLKGLRSLKSKNVFSALTGTLL